VSVLGDVERAQDRFYYGVSVGQQTFDLALMGHGILPDSPEVMVVSEIHVLCGPEPNLKLRHCCRM